MRCEEWYFLNNLFLNEDILLVSYPRPESHFARFILIGARHFMCYGCFPEKISGMKGIPDVTETP
jgi:hypothetical protein